MKVLLSVMIGVSIFCIAPAAFSQSLNGDVNGDGGVTIVDALLIAQDYVGLGPNPFNRNNADANCSGSIDIVDALLVAQYYVGLIGQFAQCNTATATATPVATSTPTPAVTATPAQTGGTTVTSATELANAIAAAAPGSVITISGTITTGRLNLTASGTASAMITLQGGKLNFAGNTSAGIVITGAYWKLSGIEAYGGGDRGIQIKGGMNNVLENCFVHNFGNMGIEINEGGGGNLVTGCRSNENYDEANGGENADGFACKADGAAGNVFRDCTADHNSDDGWDLYNFTAAVTFYNCTATRNGYGTDGDGDGFKLGGPSAAANHVLHDCIANDNTHYGFSTNYNPGTVTLDNCTGSGNADGLFNGF